MSGCRTNLPPAEIPMNSPGGSGEANTMSNIGGGVELFKIKNLLDLQLRTLVAGDGMSISISGDTVVFESSGGISDGTSTNNTLRWDGSDWVEDNFLLNDGTKVGIGAIDSNYLFNVEGTSVNSLIRVVNTGASGAALFGSSNLGTAVQINQGIAGAGNGLTVSMENAGTGKSILINSNKSAGDHFVVNQNVGGYKDIFRIDFLGNIVSNPLKTTTAHSAGYHSLYVDSATGLVYSQAGPSGGVTTAENVGTGDGWWKDESSGSLRFKSLLVENGLTKSAGTDEVTIGMPPTSGNGILANNGGNWEASQIIRVGTGGSGTGYVGINTAQTTSSHLSMSASTGKIVQFLQSFANADILQLSKGGGSGYAINIDNYGTAQAIDIYSHTRAGINISLGSGNTYQFISASTIGGGNFNVYSDGDISTSGSLSLGALQPLNINGTAVGGGNVDIYMTAGAGTSYDLFLPLNQGGAGTVLENDGSGNLTWVVPSGGGISDGTGTGNMLYWNGSDWTENANVIIDGSTFRLKSGYDLVIDDAGEIVLKDLDNSNSITLTAPNVVNSDYAIQLPADAPTDGQILKVVNAGTGETDWVDFPDIVQVTINHNLPQINVGSSYQAFWSVTGAELGGTVAVSPQNGLGADIIITYARVSSTNNIEVRFANIGSSNVDLTARDFYITVINP